MINIKHNPELAQENSYDAIIIGGGIYGVMLSLIASQRKLKTLLLERDDFGGATSFNSLRIIHGGFRYLQNMDLHRFFESVSDRRWFLQNFPDLVKPIPCLIPLYGNGVYRPLIFKIALLLNDILSFRRNKNVSKNAEIPGGKIISAAEVKNIFPDIDASGLKGGAIWYDGSMLDSQRVLMQTLKWACSLGAVALNYFEVEGLLKKDNKVTGVKAYDKNNNKHCNFNSKIIINAAGPWSRKVAEGFDREYKELFRSSIAWNVLFNKKFSSRHAIALTPKQPGARTYFLRPLRGKLFAGTVHEPWNGVEKNPAPSELSINNFINDLNSLMNLNLKREDIMHVFSGHMPVNKEGTDDLSDREVIIDHAENDGPKGLFSVSGVKFTTARLVAEKTINRIFNESNKQHITLRENIIDSDRFNIDWNSTELDESTRKILREMILIESVIHLDDLLLRRTSLGDNPTKALELAPEICSLFDWDEQKRKLEIDRLKDFFYKKNKSPKTMQTLNNILN